MLSLIRIIIFSLLLFEIQSLVVVRKTLSIFFSQKFKNRSTVYTRVYADPNTGLDKLDRKNMTTTTSFFVNIVL